jgi:hypothetical protein
LKRRLFYGAAVLLVIAAGLISRRPPLHDLVGDSPGDALWAMMVYFILAALRPTARKSKRAAAALAIAYLVEILQLWRAPWLVDLRATSLGHLALGSSFSLTDLVAYTVGVAIAFGLDAAIGRGSK